MKERIMNMIRGLDFYIGEHKDGLIFSDGKDFYAIKPVKKKKTYESSELNNLPTSKKDDKVEKKVGDNPFPIKETEDVIQIDNNDIEIIETNESDVNKLIDMFNISDELKVEMKKFR